MKKLARQLDFWPVLVLISGMTLVFSVPREAVADEASLDSEVTPESDIDSEIRELQELLTGQTSQLAEQQVLITTQQEEIDKQRALLQSAPASKAVRRGANIYHVQKLLNHPSMPWTNAGRSSPRRPGPASCRAGSPSTARAAVRAQPNCSSLS